MMNRSLFLCALLTNCTMQCMEPNNQIIPEKQKDNPWKLIKYDNVENTLKADAITYLKNRLEEYKKVSFTPQYMEEINARALQISGKPNLLTCNNGHNIMDKENNKFLHIAVHKSDVAIVTWLMNHNCLANRANAQHKEPFDICIEKLLPTSEEKNKKVAYDMLDIIIAGYEKRKFKLEYRKKFITKLLTLDLEHKKMGIQFLLKDSWIQIFLKDPSLRSFGPQKCLRLIDIYPTIVDREKNNYTHILIQHSLADELYDFIQKGYVSFTKNNTEKNPLDLALERFNNTIEKNGCTASSARCCLFMLLNYVKKQQGDDKFSQCCNKHTI